MSAARADRPDAAEVGLGHARASSRRKRWIDCQPDFETAHYLNGFTWPDGKFRFKPDWPNVPFRSPCRAGPVDADAEAARPLDHHRGGGRGASVPARDVAVARLPQFDLQRDADARARRTRPARRDDPSRRRRARSASPTARAVVLGNTRGEVRLHARLFDGVRRGVLIAESIWPNDGLSGRPRHQHAHRRGRDRALWRRGVPRQQGLDQAGLTAPKVRRAVCAGV